MAMRILAIPGSLRRGSYNRKLLRATADVLPGGAQLEIWGGLAAVPPYSEDEDREPAREPVRALREAIDRADVLLISTPEYNGTLPGQLKNAIDWASRPFPDNVLRGKRAAVIGASTGLYGAVWAQAEARKALGLAGARVVDREFAVPRAHQQFDARDGLVDGDLRARLGELVRELLSMPVAREEALAA